MLDAEIPAQRLSLAQTRAYMGRCEAAEGHLVVFDRTEGRAWDEKIFRRVEREGGAPITVWGDVIAPTEELVRQALKVVLAEAQVL